MSDFAPRLSDDLDDLDFEGDTDDDLELDDLDEDLDDDDLELDDEDEADPDLDDGIDFEDDDF